MASGPRLPIRINRNPPPPAMLPFVAVFRGFENVKAVRTVFGEQTDDVIKGLKIRLMSSRYMYMGVSDDDGSLGVGAYHLKHSDTRTLYLDVIHELFHVGQFMNDRTYFAEEHRKYLRNGFDTSLYYKSPIEIPAYRHAAEEAERIGMTYDEIADYLRIGPVDKKVFSSFLRKMNLGRVRRRAVTTLPVTIDRGLSVKFYPFTDYFGGFEKLPVVKELFGKIAGTTLGGLKIAFNSSPRGFIFPNGEERCLEVSAPYLRDGNPGLIYMDVILSLNLLRYALDGRTSDNSLLPASTKDPALVRAWKSAVVEARKVGVTDSRILEHLTVLKFVMPSASLRRFTRKLGLVVSR